MTFSDAKNNAVNISNEKYRSTEHMSISILEDLIDSGKKE